MGYEIPKGTCHPGHSASHKCSKLILKDTVVMVNLWFVYVSQYKLSPLISFRAISRDPDIFQDPQRFMPERFMKDGALCEDSSDFMWGFGRRSVPIIINVKV